MPELFPSTRTYREGESEEIYIALSPVPGPNSIIDLPLSQLGTKLITNKVRFDDENDELNQTYLGEPE